ncbi:MAG: hypothetical protein DYH08_07640 [Actinobacteria bacterium ATB1]|nr:hypothetical protein [Actinobacteria bacterium ATB1]
MGCPIRPPCRLQRARPRSPLRATTVTRHTGWISRCRLRWSCGLPVQRASWARHTFAFSGSRDATSGHLEYSKHAAAAAARAGLNVLAGHARGVDEAAHSGALDARARQLRCSPRVSTASSPDGVTCIRYRTPSFCPSSLPALCAHQAMQRNMRIAALADIVVVVVAGQLPLLQ